MAYRISGVYLKAEERPLLHSKHSSPKESGKIQVRYFISGVVSISEESVLFTRVLHYEPTEKLRYCATDDSVSVPPGIFDSMSAVCCRFTGQPSVTTSASIHSKNYSMMRMLCAIGSKRRHLKDPCRKPEVQAYKK